MVFHALLGPSARNSMQLRKTKGTFDHELLAIHLTVCQFRHHLEGILFTINTDHQPLMHAFSRVQDAWSARQRHHLSANSEYGCTICHVLGKKNPVADALSRIEINAVHTGLGYDVLVDAQPKYSITNLQWCDIPYNENDNIILCNISTDRPCPFIPACLRKRVFDLIHGLSHPLGCSTAKLLKQKFTWHNISSDTKHWARACVSCQSNKVTRHAESGVGDFHLPFRHFGHSYGHCWPPPSFSQFLIPLHHHRQVCTVVRGNPEVRSILVCLCLVSPVEMNQSFRRARTHHLRPWHALLVTTMVLPHTAP